MNDKEKNNIPNFWHSSLNGICAISAVFSLAVAFLLIANHIAAKSGLPEKELLYSQELVQKKTQLSQNPTNEQLIDEIRSLDLQIRQEYFQRRDFARRGKYLLLVGIVIFIASLKAVTPERKKTPRSKSNTKEPNIEADKQRQARKAAIVFGAIVLGSVFTLNVLQRSEVPFPVTESPRSDQVASPSNSSSPTSPTTDINPTAVLSPAEFPSPEEIQKNWPRFRGPGGLGVSIHERVPTVWNGETGAGILWKTEILLPGNNSPIVWGDRVFISGADKNGKEVFCYSLSSGELLWRSAVNNVPGNTNEPISLSDETGYAPSTMACDGSRVYAIFPDGDLIAFDFGGQRIWAKNLGTPASAYGYATSLAFYQNLLLIQYDFGGEEDGKSTLFALEGKTGGITWQSKRPVAGSWTSPILIDTGKGKQFITCSDPWVISYEPGTGEELWKANLLGADLAPSPTFAMDKVIVVKPNELLYAIKPDGQGDVTKTHIAWMIDCPAPDICSPVSNGDLIFLLGSGGDLTGYDTQTGDMVWEHKFDDTFQSSPSIAGGWIYILSEKGNTYRIKAARTYEEGEKSFLDEWLRASPAFVDNRIIIRGDRFLYCIGSQS